MRRTHDGFVLLVVIVYLQALMLLVVSVSAVLDHDSFRLVKSVDMAQLSIRAQQVLLMVEREPGECGDMSDYTVNELRKKSIRWWREYACHGIDHNYVYYFIREHVGDSKKSNNKNHVKQIDRYDIYRNTLLYVSRVSQARSVLLQSVTKVRDGAFIDRLSARFLW